MSRKPAIIVAVVLAVIGVLTVWLSLRTQGYRMLRFTTLVPVLIAFALVLRGTAPIVDALQSARPVELRLAATTLGEVPTVAVYDVPRSLEYGLGFYRNHKIASYERNEIPDGEHVVVAAEGSKTELEFRLKGRQITPHRRLLATEARLLSGVGDEWAAVQPAVTSLFSALPC